MWLGGREDAVLANHWDLHPVRMELREAESLPLIEAERVKVVVRCDEAGLGCPRNQLKGGRRVACQLRSP